MNARDAQLIRTVFDSPWAILEKKLVAIADVVRAHAAGVDRQSIDRARAERDARHDARNNALPTPAIGVLPVHGTIVNRGSWITDASGLATCDNLAAQFSAMVEDSSVESIVLDIDSPGGMVYGIQELAETIRSARGSKPIVAQAWDLAASAAYWIASAADEIVVTPSGEVGSIGVFVLHSDYSRFFDEAGITNTIIRSGKFKAETNSLEPLSDDAKAFEQSRVDDYYRAFVNAVAKGRGVAVDTVRSEFGEGRVLGAADALKRGMVDRVGTFAETVKRLSNPRARARVGSAMSVTQRKRAARHKLVIRNETAADRGTDRRETR